MNDLSIRSLQAEALFVSGVQCGDEPSEGQVRQAVAAAVRAFGCSGCSGRVAQEFGDHPETATIRMRWARAVARQAFANPAPEPGPRTDADGVPVVRPRAPAEEEEASSRGALSSSGALLLDGFVPRMQLVSVAAAFLLGAIARDVLGDPHAAWSALERAVESGEPTRPREHPTEAEARVLPYLPTNLSAREIAEEVYLSTNTVKTHLGHLYQKLGAHSRTEAVERARALGLLAPPPAGRSAPLTRSTRRSVR